MAPVNVKGLSGPPDLLAAKKRKWTVERENKREGTETHDKKRDREGRGGKRRQGLPSGTFLDLPLVVTTTPVKQNVPEHRRR